MRLLEEEGIYFWFEHTETSHVMHFADDSKSQPPIDGDPMMPATPELHADIEAVTDLMLVRRATADAYLTRDWDFNRPDKPGEALAPLAGEPRFQHYEYPGRFYDPLGGDRL